MIFNLFILIIFCIGIYFILIYNGRRVNRRLHKQIYNAKDKLYKRLLYYISKARWKRQKNMIRDELYQSASLLQNIVTIQKNTPKGAAYIIEQIASYASKLKKPLELMLYYLRMNQKENAVQVFTDELQIEAAREYGDILIRMDEVNPSELRENISLLRKKLREEALTDEKRKNEVISDLIYIPVLANMMLIFVNFIYISYFVEQKELFQQLLF